LYPGTVTVRLFAIFFLSSMKFKRYLEVVLIFGKRNRYWFSVREIEI